MSKFAEHALAVDDITSRMEVMNDSTGSPLVDENGDPSWIELRPLDSEPVRKHDRKVGDRRLATAQRGLQTLTSAQLDRETAERLAAATVAWHVVDLNGKFVDEPFATAAAVELYSLPGWSWLRRQVERHLSSQANFTQPRSTAS